MAATESSVFDAIPDAVLVVYRDRSIAHANAIAERLFGYEPGGLVGRPIEALVPEEHRRRHRELVESFFAEPAARPMGSGRELRGLRADGTEFPLEIALGPIRAGTGAVALLRDLSATVHLREELRTSEERFRIAALHSADILNVIDLLRDEITYYSDVDSIAGYEPGGFPRTLTGWLELIHPDDTERIEADMARILEKGEPTWDFHYRIRAGDGSYRHWWDRGAVTGHVDGRISEGIGTVIDETESVLARQELEAALAEVKRLKDQLEAETRYLQKEIQTTQNFEEIIGNSEPMMATLHKIDQVAPTDATVLLLGETGTGKELIARAIHARSGRRSRPLIKLDCTTLPPGLMESELFGHRKGAFTGAHESRPGRFELADGGTILLDEIGELPPELQAKLLRVLQEGTFQRIGGKRTRHVDVRVIAATNRDLHAEMQQGRFRSDLYYRLCVFPTEVPALRHRREDIPLLTYYFVTKRSKALGRRVETVPRATMEALIAYDWPGNVRELQNVIERALILSPGRDLVLAESLGSAVALRGESERSIRGDLREIERGRFLDALRVSGWKVKGEGNAASRLGLKPSTVRARMKRLGIERPN